MEAAYFEQAWICNKRRELLKSLLIFFSFSAETVLINMFLSGTVPADTSLISVCGITFDKKCSPSQETNVIAIYNFLTDQQTQ